MLGEYRLGIGAHLVRRVLDRGSAMRKFERRERHLERTVDAGDRVEFVEHAALGKMWSASASAIVRTRAAGTWRAWK